jgi:chromatin segregation and condensation protein Rec8/ScpA/Scc1 (kleisin family)
MFNSNDLLARIQAGENPDTIADEFAKQLNYAMELDRKQKEAEAATKKEVEEAKSAKLEACVQAMVKAMADYITIAEPELAAELNDSDIMDTKSVRETLDAAIAAAKFAMTLAGISPKTSTPDPKAKAAQNSDDAISQFLKSFGLLN